MKDGEAPAMGYVSHAVMLYDELSAKRICSYSLD